MQLKAQVAALTLLAALLLAANSSAARYGCCEGYSRGRPPLSIIQGYSVQTVRETCSINAIIFHTMKGRACANPALDWVIRYVIALGRRAQRVHRKTSKAT